MMSSMAWVYQVLSPASPHSVSSMVLRYCIAMHFSSA
jgi:hypothetical protein